MRQISIHPRRASLLNRPGRNDPCPCGSRKKYKRCCSPSSAGEFQVQTPSVAGKFRFEAGSYGGPGVAYAPCIICYRREAADQWATHFCLVRADCPAESQDEASQVALSDLHRAFSSGEDGRAPEAVALSLRAAGYAKVSGFRVAVDSVPGFGAMAKHDAGRGPDRSIPHAASWTDEEGVHLVAPGPAPTPEQMEALTQAFRNRIRKSPLFAQMVQQFGPSKAEELLREIKGKLK